jgi:hypothetical protein
VLKSTKEQFGIRHSVRYEVAQQAAAHAVTTAAEPNPQGPVEREAAAVAVGSQLPNVIEPHPKLNAPDDRCNGYPAQWGY